MSSAIRPHKEATIDDGRTVRKAHGNQNDNQQDACDGKASKAGDSIVNHGCKGSKMCSDRKEGVLVFMKG